MLALALLDAVIPNVLCKQCSCRERGRDGEGRDVLL